VASKHAVLRLTKTAAVEYGRYGIRVNAVSPGAVRTEMLLEVFGSDGALDQMGSIHPIGRIGRPEEIADAPDFPPAVVRNTLVNTGLQASGGPNRGRLERWPMF
jgi:NAD(P)-dependent dehydrogenase (short-subunit alcohol dehydrogenase family)